MRLIFEAIFFDTVKKAKDEQQNINIKW